MISPKLPDFYGIKQWVGAESGSAGKGPPRKRASISVRRPCAPFSSFSVACDNDSKSPLRPDEINYLTGLNYLWFLNLSNNHRHAAMIEMTQLNGKQKIRTGARRNPVGRTGSMEQGNRKVGPTDIQRRSRKMAQRFFRSLPLSFCIRDHQWEAKEQGRFIWGMRRGESHYRGTKGGGGSSWHGWLSESRSKLVGYRGKWHQMPHEARLSRHKVRDLGVVSRFQLWLIDHGWFCADLHRCLFMHYIN